MIKLPKTPFIIFGLAIIILSALAFPVVKSRYFPAEQKNETVETILEETTPSDSLDETSGVEFEEDDETINLEEDESEDDSEDFDDEDIDDIDEEDLDDTIIIEDNSFLEILSSDCKNGCKDFEEAEDIKYCKQYCGLVSTPKTSDGCDKFEDLEKDYCFKEEAIEKKDGKICNEIEDDGIKKSCFNRITEDILDAPQSAE